MVDETEGNVYQLDMPISRHLALVAMATASLLLAGCGSRFSTYCNQQQQCSGGNSKDVSACEDATEGEFNAASDYGCGDAANTYANCLNQKFSCSAGKAACSNEATAMSACECAASAMMCN